jgi:hypothetical protein
VAAWFASGVETWGQNRIGEGDLSALFATYRDLGVPEAVIDATAWAIKKEREPIFTVFPLLALTVDLPQVVNYQVQSIALVGDVPLCALDKFTRTGKAAIAELTRSSTAIAIPLNGVLPTRQWAAATGLGVFYSEGFLVTPKLEWSQSTAIERLGMEADFLRLGLPAEHIPQFLAVITAELPDLNRIRTRLLATVMPMTGGHHG